MYMYKRIYISPGPPLLAVAEAPERWPTPGDTRSGHSEPPEVIEQTYVTENFHKVIVQESVPAKKRHRILYHY